MKLSKVIVPHDLNCRSRNSRDEWSGLISGHFWGNFAANENADSRNHIWHKVTCNDPHCKAIKAVHFSVLSNA